MFLGVIISDMNLGNKGWGIMVGWTAWSILLPLIIEILKISFGDCDRCKFFFC